MDPATKRKSCADATDFIIDQVNGAIRTLQEASLIVNGFGILSDVSQSSTSIATARNRLDQALEKLNAVEWLTRADYDQW